MCSASQTRAKLRKGDERIASWNCFPEQDVSSLIKRLRLHHDTKYDTNKMTDNSTTTPTLWFEMSCIRHKGDDSYVD